MANPNYMDLQTEIEWPMRATLIDWLLQVHMRYHMLPETLWITINIVDRFLSSRIVSLVKLQLVGITAMFVAAKYEEIMAPSVDEFVYMTENNYSREEILKGERILLQVSWQPFALSVVYYAKTTSTLTSAWTLRSPTTARHTAGFVGLAKPMTMISRRGHFLNFSWRSPCSTIDFCALNLRSSLRLACT
jgi:hypothetical protein